MTNLDDQIRAALSAEEKQELEHLSGEQGVFDKIGDTFRSKMRFWIMLIWTEMIVLIGVIAWTGWKFFNATEPRDMIIWGAFSILGVLAIWVMKIWYWMEINKNTVVREVKRLELQVAYLTKSITEK